MIPAWVRNPFAFFSTNCRDNESTTKRNTVSTTVVRDTRNNMTNSAQFVTETNDNDERYNKMRLRLLYMRTVISVSLNISGAIARGLNFA
jgi:hypothetical protein